MATDEELAALAEQAVNPSAMATPSPAPNAPVIGTPEGPGIPPIAPVTTDAPEATQTIAAPSTPQKAPVVIPNAGVDTRALDLAHRSGTDLADAQANRGPALAESAEAQAQGLESQAQAQRDQQVEVQAEEQAQKDGIAEARRVADEAHEAVKDFKPHDFWGDRTAGQAIRSNIAYALGGWTSSQLGGPNQVAEKIKSMIETQGRKDQMKLQTLENFAKYKENGVQDLQSQYRDDLAKLKLRQAMALGAVADEAKAMLLRKNVPLQEAENNVLVKQFQNERDKEYAKGFEQLTRDKAMMALERAKLANSQPEDPAKMAILAKAAQIPGVTQADLYALASKIGIKDANKAVIPVEKNPDAEDAAEKKKNAALEQRTVYVNGTPIGLAPSPRVVKSISDRAIQYEDAIKSLEDLKTQVDNGLPIINRIPQGDAYNRAVLAVAATTTANASDATTAHEANTIKNFGLVSTDAIDKTLEHLRDRQKKFQGQLQPLPGEGGEKSPAGESKPSGSGVPSVDKIRALPEADRKDAIEATAALRNPEKRAKAEKFLRHLGVM